MGTTTGTAPTTTGANNNIPNHSGKCLLISGAFFCAWRDVGTKKNHSICRLIAASYPTRKSPARSERSGSAMTCFNGTKTPVSGRDAIFIGPLDLGLIC